MKPVSVAKCKTPMAANPDCAWSVGVMFLTEAEADLIAQFARGIRSTNSPRANGITATEMRSYDDELRDAERARIADKMERYRSSPMNDDSEARKRWLAGAWDEPTSDPELEMPGNRFSGLDIPGHEDK